MIKAITVTLAIAPAALITACSTASNPPAASSATCAKQYSTWRAGRGEADLVKVMSGLNSVTTSVNATARLTAALKQTQTAAQAAQAVPIPACADPAGYYAKFLTKVSAARTAGPMEHARLIEQQLGTELLRTVKPSG